LSATHSGTVLAGAPEGEAGSLLEHSLEVREDPPAAARSRRPRARLTDRYDLYEEIGRGGFGIVHRGLDRELDRVVAIKWLPAERVRGGEEDPVLQRFLRESKLIASLNHKNIVQVYDLAQDERGWYIVMEYVRGGTLRERLKRERKLGGEEAMRVMRGMCEGLGLAHRKNLVHRDLKPANVLLAPDGDVWVAKIVDFGLARSGEENDVSSSGAALGTPVYRAPEQRRNAKHVNHTADIFSLGKMLYEMVTGDYPESVDPESIPAVANLSRIILKCTKNEPAERYFSVDELLADLDALPAKAAGGAAERGKDPRVASRDRPWENSLGMRMVPVPGTSALFCLWPTRVQDFETFVKATGHATGRAMWVLAADGWKHRRGFDARDPCFAQGPTHPVVGVNWEDAQAFCRWLTDSERSMGQLGPEARYRLPTDAEWSAAVGRSKYPWGDAWPPPAGSGNFAGGEARDAEWPMLCGVIHGYEDEHARTSPVGSYRAHPSGLFDLGGNVWEWCEDWYRSEMNTEELRQRNQPLRDDGGGQAYRVFRGGSWFTDQSDSLLSAFRDCHAPDVRGANLGFRVVLVGGF